MWTICFAFNIFLEDSHLLSLCIIDLVCISGNHVHVRYAGQRVTTVLRLPGVLLHSSRLQPAAAYRELTQVLFLLIGMLRLSTTPLYWFTKTEPPKIPHFGLWLWPTVRASFVKVFIFWNCLNFFENCLL